MNNLEWYYEHDSDFAWKVNNWAYEAGGFSTSQPLDEIPWTHPKMHEWLLSEHANDDKQPESVVRADSVDANDENADSREKLEADVREWMHEHIIQPHDNITQLIGWLDRQAAITANESSYDVSFFTEFATQVAESIADERDELQAKVDELQSENERLREHMEKVDCDCDCCNWQAERDSLQDRIKQQSELIESLYAKLHDSARRSILRTRS